MGQFPADAWGNDVPAFRCPPRRGWANQPPEQPRGGKGTHIGGGHPNGFAPIQSRPTRLTKRDEDAEDVEGVAVYCPTCAAMEFGWP